MNYYEILWVGKDASNDDIKKAYRKMAMQHHPDRGGNAETFKEINEAYWVLSDFEKRKEYDRFWKVSSGSNPFSWGGMGFDVDLGDIFEQFFWGAQKQNRRWPRNQSFRGEDIEYSAKIDLKTSIFGGKINLEYDQMITCDNCHGEWWKWKKTCSECWGSGYVSYRQQTMFGTIEHRGACNACQGSGEVIQEVCQKCGGKKRIKKKRTLEIDVPAGIDEGMVIKLEWEWNEGIGAGAWDLFVRFDFPQTEKSLTRKGVNLTYELDLDVIEAILGTTKDLMIPILGKRSIHIEAGTQFGTVLKIAGDGVKYIDRDRKWDLYINLIIKIPKKLSDSERKVYEQLATEKKLNVHNKKGILEKLFG